MFSHTSQYNLLFIVTDQQRYDAVGYINDLVQTPNLNRLASESAICTQAVVQSPQCQPSRASFLTGLYPDRIQMWWNETKLASHYQTIGNHLSQYGYDIGYFGKLHIDGDADYKTTAKHYGFKHSFLSEDWIGLLQSDKAYAAHVARHEFYSPMRTDYDYTQSILAPWTGKLTSQELHHEDIIISNTIQFLKQRRHNSAPFACFVSFHGPHPPYCSPPPYNSLYQYGDLPLPEILSPTWFGHQLTKSDWHHIKSQYYGSIAWIDNYIGQILELVDLNKTIIVFTSDHGDILGDHGFFSKGVFTYEGNVRVPLIIKWPHMVPVHYNHTVQLVDLLPTIMSLMGLPLSYSVDGIDLYQAIAHNLQVNRYAFSAISMCPRHYMIRSTDYKYSIGQEQSFYDLGKDPCETINLINDLNYMPTINQMKSDLLEHLSLFNNQFANHTYDLIRKANDHVYFA